MTMAMICFIGWMVVHGAHRSTAVVHGADLSPFLVRISPLYCLNILACSTEDRDSAKTAALFLVCRNATVTLSACTGRFSHDDHIGRARGWGQAASSSSPSSTQWRPPFTCMLMCMLSMLARRACPPARCLDEVRLEMSFGERGEEERRPFHHFSASSISLLSRDKQKPTGTSSVGRSDRSELRLTVEVG